MKRLIWICVIVLLAVGALAQDHKRLTNLPHLYVNTFTGNPVVSKSEQVWARMWLVDEQDVVTFYDSISIRGRGNSTWNMDKKPYRIKLQTATKLLGDNRANAKKWTLLANHGDKTMMRNALASYIGDLCGHRISPDGEHIKTFLDQRIIAIDPVRLKKIPRKVILAAGRNKAESIIAACRGGYADILVTDEIAAMTIQRMLRAN